MLILNFLGFYSIVIFLFVVFPVIGLVIRRKWRVKVAKMEEISRFVDFMAVEEVARGEVAPPRVAAAAVVSQRVCVVCYTVTSNRCARCKSVNYCSGKCQIYHWREGHKDECKPLTASSQIPCDVQGETPREGHRFSNSEISSPDVFVKDDAGIDVCVSVEESDSVNVDRDNSVFGEVHASSPDHNIHISESNLGEKCVQNPNSESCDLSSPSEKSSRHIEQITVPEDKSYTRVGIDGGISVSRDLKENTLSGKTNSSDLRVSHVMMYNREPSISTSEFWDGILNTCRTRKYVPNNSAKRKSVGVGDKNGNEKVPDLKSNVQLFADSNGPSSDTHLQSHDSGIAAAKVVVKTISETSKRPTVRMRMAEAEEHRNISVVDTSKASSLPFGSFKANLSEKNNQSMQPSLVSQKGGFFPEKSNKLASQKVGFDDAIKIGAKATLAYDSFVKLYHWNKLEIRPCGLINCGNSCYANVVLQCLTFTPPLTGYLLQGLHSKGCVAKEWCFTCEFEKLTLKSKELGYPQSPTAILSHIQKIGSHLTNGREEDAHEFLRYAIETMQSICLKEAVVKDSSLLEEETTLIGLTFGGYLRSKIKCARCRGKSVRRERMMDLTVEIEGDIQTLEDALRQFTRTETLDGENKYHCGRCKSYEKAKKKLNILEAPNILTIALKRFQSGKFGKLNKAIQFPEMLNLAPYMRGGSDKAPIYKLYGIVVHLDRMNASFTGHYVCYVRNAHNKWFKVDDSTVKPVELDQVLNKGAYMLLYSRCSPRAPPSIRSTMVSRDLPSKVNNLAVDASRGSDLISTSRQSGLPAQTNHNPVDLGNLGYIHEDGASPSSLHDNQDFDSLSDSSSIFSNSDVVSNSTDSTSSSSSSSSSPEYLKRSPLSYSERYASALSQHNVLLNDNSKARHETFLHSNSSSRTRNSVNISNSELDVKRLGRANPLDNGNSGVQLRRSSRKRGN